MNCPRCGRALSAPKLFTNPKGSGYKIECVCGNQIISDTYENFVKAGLAQGIIK